MSILGNRVLRVEDPRLLTRGGTYLADVELPGACHVAYVRSPMAHALITGIDASEARQARGVVAVLTAEDVDAGPLAAGGGAPPVMGRPLLARDRVRFSGEAVAVVVADSMAHAVDAAELVAVDYEPLPAVIGVEEALETDTLLFPEAGSNLAFEFTVGDVEDALRDCEVVVSRRIVNQRISAAPLEPRGVAATIAGDGRLTVWLSTQGPHNARNEIAGTLGLDDDAVRVIAPDVGGGFGTKTSLMPEEMLVPWLVRRLQRPVRWTETRTENLLSGGHGRAQVQNVTIGGTRDGHIEVYRLDILQDGGAYPAQTIFMSALTRLMAQGVYDIPHVAVRGRVAVTTTAPVIAFRGAGRPEAAAAIERAVDMFAAEIGMDPAGVRRSNVIARDAFPYTTRTGRTFAPDEEIDPFQRRMLAPAVYDSGNYAGALDRLLDIAGYAQLREEQARRRASSSPLQLGLGLSLYVEITSLMGGQEGAALEIRPDGTALLRVGPAPQGQGHATTWTMLVADRLGLPLEAVEVRFGDTDVFPTGGLTGGSRSVQVVGSAVAETSDRMVERARERTAEMLEADVADVVFDRDGGRFHVAGSPASAVGWADLAAAPGGLSVQHSFNAVGATYPFGAHLAVVEVDVETGKVALQRFVTVDDAGRIINPLLAQGQLHGGLAQGVAQALLESIEYDAEGNLLTSTFADYEVITATELCDFEVNLMETPTPLNELGAKGIGESGSVGATPAAENAVADALGHLGVRHVDMPCTPRGVLAAIRAAEAVR